LTDDPGSPLPPVRCLTKEQAAAYLGIGVTLLLQLVPPPIKFGRRSVWDVVDLDRWLAKTNRQAERWSEAVMKRCGPAASRPNAHVPEMCQG